MRKMIATAAGLALLATACTSDGGPPGVAGGPPRTVDLDGAVTLAAALTPFDDCDALLGHLRSEASERVGPYGLEGDGMWAMYAEQESFAADAQRSVAGTDDASPTTTAMQASGEQDGSGQPYSETNVQESGVDEPDIVKTDGEVLVTVADDRRLRVVDVAGDGEPALLGSLELAEGHGHELLLRGSRVLVLSSGWDQRPAGRRPATADMSWAPGATTARLTEVDISDPSEPVVRSTVEIDGSPLSARMVDGTVRFVVRSEPAGLGFVFPRDGSRESAERAEAVNRQVVEESTIEQWLPTVSTGDDDERPLAPCDRVHTPQEFAGFGALSLVTVDLDGGLAGPVDAVSVLAAGETVYGSADSIYVATTRWVDPAATNGDDSNGARSMPMPRPVAPAATDIHRFDTPADGPADYAASGSVTGQLLDQFSMSEHDGHLRVATTEGEAWEGARQPSESFVTTFAERDGELVQVGRVGGLGKGERIYAVRFLGDVGYVVTFREVDPLYTVDLSDPADPRVTGELKIEGYSSYLHPIGDDLLIGVGQDATLEGRTTGTQVSLFDVSDPAAPTRLHHHTIADGRSEAEVDHHAFLWWAPSGLAVLPMQSWAANDDHRSGALAMTVDPATGIVEQGWVEHPADGGWTPGVRRSVVVGDRLYTLSETGLQAADLATLAEEAWLPFR